MVGVGQGDGVNALVHLDEFVGIGADGANAVFLCQIHIGGAHAVFRLRHQAAHHHILPLPGKPTAAAELGKAEGIGSVPEGCNLLAQALCGRGTQVLIVKAHAEIYLVDDFQQVNFKLHGGKQGPLDNYGQFAAFAEASGYILPDGVPQAQELHIVVLNKANGAQVIQLLFGKAKGAQEVNLGIDFRQHFRCEADALVAAFEMVLAVQVGVLVENHLVHIEFIQVRIQQGNYDRV